MKRFDPEPPRPTMARSSELVDLNSRIVNLIDKEHVGAGPIYEFIEGYLAGNVELDILDALVICAQLSGAKRIGLRHFEQMFTPDGPNGEVTKRHDLLAEQARELDIVVQNLYLAAKGEV